MKGRRPSAIMLQTFTSRFRPFFKGSKNRRNFFAKCIEGNEEEMRENGANYSPPRSTFAKNMTCLFLFISSMGGQLPSKHVIFVVVVVVEASAPKVYPRVSLASASTLLGSVVKP